MKPVILDKDFTGPCPSHNHPGYIDSWNIALKSFRVRSEEHTSKLQSRSDLVCRLLLEKKNHTICYRSAGFAELNAWDRARADASSSGIVDARFESQTELTKMQLDNQYEIAEMHRDTH